MPMPAFARSQDAAERVSVDYEVLPASVDPLAQTPSIPIWSHIPNNVCFDWMFGNADACRSLFEEAAHTVRISLRNPRVVSGAIEPRAAIGLYEAKTQGFTLIADTQGVHFVRRVLAKSFGLSRT
jgi:aerobic carbon-monoxide dehydrogenase large subunit